MRIALVLILLAFPCQARDIFVLMGQSNMSGRGLVYEVPGFWFASQVKVYNNAGAWVHGSEPVDSAVGQIDQVSADENAGAGPGMAFGDRLAELRGTEIGLVPCAKGGSDINAWQKDWRRTTLYGSCLARTREAAQSGTIRGLLIFNGESDSNPERVELYPSRMARLITDFRQDLGLPNLPVVFTQIGPEPCCFDYFSSWGGMQARQAQIQGPNLKMVTAMDLPSFGPSSPHLTTAGYVALGRRYAEAMHQLLN